MPEGPSIIILKESATSFKGKKVTGVSGNTKEDKSMAFNQTITDFKSWGKHFLICFKGFTIRIHLMLFGSYRINAEKDTVPRLSLQFKNGVLNFYTCSVKIIKEDLGTIYDWTADVMSDTWDPASAKKKLKARPDMFVCDALLDQHICAGSGNIIKNEVLFRIKVHPASTVGSLPPRKLAEMVREVRNYSFDFLKWKKDFVLRKHWLVHTKKICPSCNAPLVKEYLGKTNRRSFFCAHCQILYNNKTE